MARLLIRQAHGGATTVISDVALPYFLSQGYVVLDVILEDDDPDEFVYLNKAESDVRYEFKGEGGGGGGDAENIAIHEANASMARPDTTAPVVWFGSVEPTNFDATKDDQWVRTEASGFTPPPGATAAEDITNSTATGRAVLTAADAAAARTAIGAGTSSLALGLTGTTAAAGNHSHSATEVGAVQAGTGIVRMERVTQAEYDAIGTKVATTLYIIVG